MKTKEQLIKEIISKQNKLISLENTRLLEEREMLNNLNKKELFDYIMYLDLEIYCYED